MSTPTKVAPQAKHAGRASARSLAPARSILLQRKCACGTLGGSGECQSCKKEEEEKSKTQKSQTMQRSARGHAPSAPVAPPAVNRVLNSPGQGLDSSTRSFMEGRFGRDFSAVRVHTGHEADVSAQSVNAHAYTVGQDIVFSHGKYDPKSAGGRQLLAHELAHTVQQNGLQRSTDGIPVNESHEYHQLEREADSVANAVMSGTSVPALGSRPSGPLVSRARDDKKSTASSTKANKDAEARDWEDIDDSSLVKKSAADLKAQGVTQVAKPPVGTSVDDIVAFNMGELVLPKEKGKKAVVEKVWQDVADRGALQAIIDPSGDVRSTKVALKQERPPTDELKRIWLQKVGWKREDAEANWKKAATSKDSFLGSLTADKNPCQIDHILELQFGGNNVKENMQVLDGPENMQSGREIFQGIKAKAVEIRAGLKKDGLAPKNLILFYESAKQPSDKCESCCKAEIKAQGIAGVGEGESVKGKQGEEYPIAAGGPATSLLITEPYLSNKKTAVPIRDSEVPENKSAATIISGLLLDKLHRVSPGKDSIDAVFDKGSGTKTRLPVTLKNEKPVALHVAKDGKLTLAQKNPHLEFHYPYLSDGVFTKLEIQEDQSLSGEGTLTPTISFLPKLGVKFDKDNFVVTTDLKNKLKSPLPNFHFTKAELGLVLAPEFKPYGELAFEYKRGGKNLLDGGLTVSADGQGLLAQGKVNAYIPGIDKAEGDITFQNNLWSGGVTIEATQLQSKFKYVKSGTVIVGFKGKEISASGNVNLAIPGTDGVDVGLFYQGNRWVFKGTGKFKPPRLEETEIHIEYDGVHITGYGSTGFKLYGLSGTITVVYRDDKFSGKGDINFEKGKAKGKLHVEMTPEHKFFGSGEITYQITENLIGTAGIEIDKEEKVKLKGALEFPKPIHIFDPIKGDYKIFEIGISIPIPGLSIPAVGGVNARIEGALSAGYQIGPGEIRNVKALATFNPFEDKKDLDILLSGQFYIGMNAHISGTIRGGIEVSIAIASIAGGLSLTATAALNGHVLSNVELHYMQGRFEAKADFDLLLKLILTLAIDAWIRAKAGIGWLSVESEKVWNLASFTYDPGLQVGMKLKKPIRYASDEGFQFPSLDDIEWIKPQIDAGDVLGRLFKAQDPEPKPV